MVDYLTAHQNMTFQWAETVFLERWFRDITPERRNQVGGSQHLITYDMGMKGHLLRVALREKSTL